MKNWGNCPTGEEIRRLVQVEQGLPESTVPVLVLTSVLGSAMLRLLAESVDESEVVMVLIIPDKTDPGDDYGIAIKTGPERGLDEATLDASALPDRSIFAQATFDMVQELPPEFRLTEEPYWLRMNSHPHRPGRGQSKGGSPLRPQKRGRS